MCAAPAQFMRSDIRDDDTGNHFDSDTHRVVIALPPLTSVRAQPCMRLFVWFACEKSPATPGKSPEKPVGIPALVPAQKPALVPVGMPVGKPTGMPLGMASGWCLEVRS